MRVLFRFEASQTVGMGHAMRCLGLTQALVDHGHVCRAVTLDTPAGYCTAWQVEAERVPERLTLVPMAETASAGSREDALQTKEACREFNADWLVLDHYGFGPGYQRQVAGLPLQRLYFDDLGQDFTGADIILNQNACGTDQRATRDEGMVRLAGTEYFQARRAFRSTRADPAKPKRILVTLGGADSQNTGFEICRKLHSKLPAGCRIDFACTADATHWEEVRAYAADHAGLEAHLRPDLHALMSRASLAICGGGVTSLELACIGVPSVILVMAGNQLHGARALVEGRAARLAQTPGAAVDLAAELLTDENVRQLMADRAVSIVDGNGPDRIVHEMEQLAAKRT